MMRHYEVRIRGNQSWEEQREVIGDKGKPGARWNIVRRMLQLSGRGGKEDGGCQDVRKGSNELLGGKEEG